MRGAEVVARAVSSRISAVREMSSRGRVRRMSRATIVAVIVATLLNLDGLTSVLRRTRGRGRVTRSARGRTTRANRRKFRERARELIATRSAIFLDQVRLTNERKQVFSGRREGRLAFGASLAAFSTTRTRLVPAMFRRRRSRKSKRSSVRRAIATTVLVLAARTTNRERKRARAIRSIRLVRFCLASTDRLGTIRSALHRVTINIRRRAIGRISVVASTIKSIRSDSARSTSYSTAHIRRVAVHGTRIVTRHVGTVTSHTVSRGSVGHAVIADRLLAVGTHGVSKMRMRMTLLHKVRRVTVMLVLRVSITRASIGEVVLVAIAILYGEVRKSAV